MTTPSGKHPIDPLASVTREHAGLGYPGVKPSGSVLPWLLTMPSPDAPTRANERAGAERHPVENYHNPQPAVEPGITKSENVPLDESIRAPEGLREHPDWYTADAAPAFRALRHYVSAGERLPPQIWSAWEAAGGHPILDGLGCSNASGT